MTTFPSLEVFQAFADYARPITDAEWGSMRQTEAQNTFFNFAEQWFPLQFRDGGKFSNYALKATTEEMLDYALEIIRKHHPSGAPPVAARPDAPAVVQAERVVRTWRDEFPDMPADAMPEIPEGFVDESWHNDTCPCFWSEARGVRLWVDYPDRERREEPTLERFSLMAGEHASPDQIEVLRTENWSDVLKALEQDDEEAAPVVAAPARIALASGVDFKTPIRDLEQGKAWLKAMKDNHLTFHLEDDPASIVSIPSGERLFTDEQAADLRLRVDELYGMDWGQYDCPIGYILHLEGHEDFVRPE